MQGWSVRHAKNTVHRLYIFCLCHSLRSERTPDKQFTRHNVCGCRCVTNFIVPRFPFRRSLSLFLFLSPLHCLSLCLPFFFLRETGKSPRTREWTPREKFVSLWCRARLTTRESSIVKSRRSVTNNPANPFATGGRSLHVRWFYDKRFRSGHYGIHPRRGRTGPAVTLRRSSGRRRSNSRILNRSRGISN